MGLSAAQLTIRTLRTYPDPNYPRVLFNLKTSSTLGSSQTPIEKARAAWPRFFLEIQTPDFDSGPFCTHLQKQLRFQGVSATNLLNWVRSSSRSSSLGLGGFITFT